MYPQYARRRGPVKTLAITGSLLAAAGVLIYVVPLDHGTIPQWNGLCNSGLGQFGQLLDNSARQDCGIVGIAAHLIGWLIGGGAACLIGAFVLSMRGQAGQAILPPPAPPGYAGPPPAAPGHAAPPPPPVYASPPPTPAGAGTPTAPVGSAAPSSPSETVVSGHAELASGPANSAAPADVLAAPVPHDSRHRRCRGGPWRRRRPGGGKHPRVCGCERSVVQVPGLPGYRDHVRPEHDEARTVGAVPVR
jgi:hypothetical protein